MVSLPYTPPLDDIRFNLHLLGLDELIALPWFDALTPDLVEAILEEGGKFATTMLAPINDSGDREGCQIDQGKVRSPSGFRDAYKAFIHNGWNGASCDPQYGGQGLPQLVHTALSEMWNSANMAFALCPMLTQGAIELIERHGSEAQKKRYLPRLVEGVWSGTMCMTEPQAGSDVGALRTTAEPDGDHYMIRGTKIYITWGEHDLTENIIHMVLARLPGAPEGVKGLSLFLVPKFLPDDDGAPGQVNDVHCLSIEHKMGIHASPTCVLAFGEHKGAVGYLVGEANGGIQAMFTMMNAARLSVGMEGIGILERARQMATTYAHDRIQGKHGGKPSVIAHHGDVARMLATMQAHAEGLRALALYAGRGIDLYRHHTDEAVRLRHRQEVDLLIPVIKAHGTDTGFAMASMAAQVFGGLGYIEETGISQLMRDVRVAMIYEGTNGIQARDLVFRKVPMEGGAVIRRLIDDMRAQADALSARGEPDMQYAGTALRKAVADLVTATDCILADPSQAEGVEVHYLELLGLTLEGTMLARQADAILRGTVPDIPEDFAANKCNSAHFFAKGVLPQTASLRILMTGK